MEGLQLAKFAGEAKMLLPPLFRIQEGVRPELFRGVEAFSKEAHPPAAGLAPLVAAEGGTCAPAV